MTKKRAVLWVGIPFLLLIIFLWARRLYLQPHQGTGGVTADFIIPADSLYLQYQANERAADRKYLGKVIQVSGKLAEIQHNGNSEIWILSPQPGGGGINCQLFAGTRFNPKN